MPLEDFLCVSAIPHGVTLVINLLKAGCGLAEGDHPFQGARQGQGFRLREL
jgi:hypothetical protein